MNKFESLFGPSRAEKRETLIIQSESAPSEKHPERNEDSLFLLESERLFGVLDGMGGRAAGDVASTEARDYILKNASRLRGEPAEIGQELKKILIEVGHKIAKLAEENPTLRGMGTTASVVKIWEGERGEKKAIIGNVGDSRVYVLDKEGKLRRITIDDNAVRMVTENDEQAAELQDRLDNVTDLESLSPIEKMLFKERHKITQALGASAADPEITVIEIHAGEKIIMTSDGVHDNLASEEIEQIVSQNGGGNAGDLIRASKERSRDSKHLRAKKDDMSAIVIEIK